jgi:hypothetical protein
MAKRKDSTALFEVIGRGSDARKQMVYPQWAEAPTEAVPHEASPRPAKPLRCPPGLDAGQGDIPAASSERWVTVDHNRLRLSLTYTTGLIVVMSLLLVLAATYKLGQASGRSAGGTATVDFPQDKLQARFDALPPQSMHMIIEPAVASRDEATAIQKFLYENGTDAAIKPNGNAWAVVDLDMNFWHDGSPTAAKAMTAAAKKQYDNLVKLGQRADWALRDKYDFSRAGKTEADWHIVK